MVHDEKPPDVEKILSMLHKHDVKYVVTGSVAAQFYGVNLEPGDLDIVPATDEDNLERLVLVLSALEARPPGPFGEWTTLPNGEQKWIARDTTEEEIAAWAPDIRDVSTFDHLFRTRLGNFDVVPRITGTYETLKKRAVPNSAYGCPLWLAHIDELLWRLTVPRREKDVPRVASLREIQRGREESGAAPAPLLST